MSSENNDGASDTSVHVEWSSQVEDILAAEGEKCRGLSWIHTRCETEMSRFNTFIQVPVIVLSTLAGTASVGSATLFAGQTTASSIAIGLVSISVGIMNTLGGFFNFAKRAESHRIAHLHYSKIASKISIELSLPRLERISAESLLNYVRESMERLAETTPLAPEKILHNFNTEFKELKNEIAMPPETNGLHKIKVYRSNGPIPTPIASFSLEKMEQGLLGDKSLGELSELKARVLELTTGQEATLKSIRESSEASARKMVEEAQQKSAEEILQSKELARIAVESAQASASQAASQAAKILEQIQQEFLRKQDMLELQIKSMEKTLLPITQCQSLLVDEDEKNKDEKNEDETNTSDSIENLNQVQEEAPKQEESEQKQSSVQEEKDVLSPELLHPQTE